MKKDNIFLKKIYFYLPFFYAAICLFYLKFSFILMNIVFIVILFLSFFSYPIYLLYKNHPTFKHLFVFIKSSIFALSLLLIYGVFDGLSSLGSSFYILEIIGIYLIPIFIMTFIYLLIVTYETIKNNSKNKKGD